MLPIWGTAQVCVPTACKGPNLVLDGNFESVTDPNNPVLNFVTEFGYAYCPTASPQDLWGKITVRQSPSVCYSTWTGYDHTTGDSSGRMLMVDFPDVDPGYFFDIWEQDVPVEAGETYCFGAWYRNLNVGVTMPRPNFRYLVNGNLIGTSAYLSNDGNWYYYGFNYTIPSGITSATITIQNGKFGGNGNDLAVDDIEFRKLLNNGSPPDAMDDNVYLPTGSGTIAIPVLVNDVSNVSGVSLDPSLLSIRSWPAADEGSITIGASGVIDFTPAPGFVGNASFSYEICNPLGCCSEATVYINIDYVLPAKIEQFQGLLDQKVANLSWFTPANSQLVSFQVERSYDQQTFRPVGKVDVQGSPNLPGYYQFQDEEVLNRTSDRVYYRLQQFDIDGKISMSPMIEIDLRSETGFRYSVYPNPVVDGVLNLQYFTPELNDVEFRIYTLSGQLIHRQTLITNTPQSHTRIDVSDLPRAMYMLSLSNGRTEVKERVAILN
ncbi:MAG: T9SS type A sorting domain-containing protein [Bacteroidota bacterium]